MSLTPAQPARGRPTAFNPDRAEKLINAIRGGAYQKQAAEHAGISYNTLRRWLIKAQSEEATPELIEFAQQIEDAEIIDDLEAEFQDDEPEDEEAFDG